MIIYSHIDSRHARTFRRTEAADWADFERQVMGRHRTTSETAVEYAAMDAERQTEIKDVGGFVAGTFRGDRRSKDAMEGRFALTLDVDGDTPDMKVLGALRLIYPCRHFWHTTHKSTARVPRYRIVCELSRTVTAAEYALLSRALCGALGLAVDPCTHQPERIMFYPSSSVDGDRRAGSMDGEPLNADALLAMVPPEETVPDEIRTRRQADPRRKAGLVGAFCRAYSVDRVIRELIPGVYRPCGEGRYSYRDSHTAAGAVAMENGLYLYSFHASDPNANTLMNAFDLARLVKFAHLDEGTKKGGAQAPSYKAMEDWCAELPAVTEELRRASLPQDGGEWVRELDIKKSGDMRETIANYEMILRNDPQLAGAVCLNEFAHRLEVVRPLPWRSPRNRGEWTDSDDAGLRAYVERRYRNVNRANLLDALVNVFEERRRHPVREYLDGCEWDGVRRLDTLLVDYMGAEDTPYTRAVTRKALAAAVARIYRPGVKFDYVLTLVGREGVGKSTLFAKLGGAWFSDTFLSVSGKEAVEQLQGVWIIEIGEMAGLKKAEVEAIKAYISSREDRVRLAYAKRTATFPRECVFVATTNNPTFLRSANGNRRFWPVEVGRTAPRRSLWDDLTEEEVAQVWAEARKAYEDGEGLYLTGGEAAVALAKQEAHQEGDEWESAIAEYLERPLPAGWTRRSLAELAAYFQSGGKDDDPFAAPGPGEERRAAVCPRQVWCECLGRPLHELDGQRTRRINAILNDLPGWERAEQPRKFGPYGLNRCYVRAEEKE